MNTIGGLILKAINLCNTLYMQLMCFVINKSLWGRQLSQDIELIGVVGHNENRLHEEGWRSKWERIRHLDAAISYINNSHNLDWKADWLEVCGDAKKRISNHFGVHMPKRYKDVANSGDIKMMESWEMSEVESLAEKFHKVQYGVQLVWAVVIGYMPVWLFFYIAINMGDVNYEVIIMSILAVGLCIAVMASIIKKVVENKWVKNSIKQLAEECERRFTHLDASVQRLKLHNDFSALETRRAKLTAL